MRLQLDFGRQEKRSSPENPSVSLSDPEAWRSLLGEWMSVAGPAVTVQTALGVPAFWCGVNFLAEMMASIPFAEFKKADAGREKQTTGPVAGLLSGCANDDYLTWYKFIRGRLVSMFTTGAGRAFIEKNRAGRPVNLWPLETRKTTRKRVEGRTIYTYRDAGKTHTYQADEVFDLTWMDKDDGVGFYEPIKVLKDTLGLAIALEQYASKFFQNGGVPPLALHTRTGSPAAAARAKADVKKGVREANNNRDDILVLPDNTELKPIGVDPDKGQLTEARRFIIEQIARVLGLPPVFLQDLSHGNFANAEQQDLYLVKHRAGGLVQQVETEMNAKFYGLRAGSRYVEGNLDGLQRGDFKTRMEGWARAIQTSQVTPNEVRRAENRPDLPGGDKLYIQGATVPLEDAGKFMPRIPAPKTETDDVEA
jgi:HK97 family phage portal protein